MKKRIWLSALLLSTVIAASGCSQKQTEEKDTDAKTEETSSTEDTETQEGEEEQETEDTKTTAELMAEIDVAKCITLGEYKGLTVEKAIDAVVEKAVKEALAEYPVEADKTAEEGDTVNIDYVGTIEGEEFEGGSDQGADLVLGSGQFIDGFEEGLIGAAKGETRTLDLTFPDQYTEELAGKAVQFTVTVNAVKTPLEEPTDEWVAANIEGYYTLDEYKEALRSESDTTQNAEEQMRISAWTQAVDNSTVNEYPESLVEIGRQLYMSEVEMRAVYVGMDLDGYLEASGMTKEEYEAAAEEYGKNVAKQMLVCQAISDAEGYAIGDEGYKAELEKMLTKIGTTEEELTKIYGQDNVEQNIMLTRVSNLIMDNAVIVEPEADEAEASEETE
ncbi:MAG: FKBP-type peptidyl-prolyl cis-trans isomerase [Clostridiales bacterium]|nr:FKBP-type peptidyl-prolyl cis-trans isomerase [Clostridiales bacterium]